MKHSKTNIEMYKKGVAAGQTALIPNFRDGVQAHPWFFVGWRMGTMHGPVAGGESHLQYMDKYLEELPDLRVTPQWRAVIKATMEEVTVGEEFTRQNAEIIKQQLGGSRFALMTGAKDFMFDSKGSYLSFKIGSGAKGGINYVKVIYNKRGDDYTMEFCTFRGLKVTVKHRVEGVYGDQLREIFTKYTGFYWDLGTLGTRRESVEDASINVISEESKAESIGFFHKDHPAVKQMWWDATEDVSGSFENVRASIKQMEDALGKKANTLATDKGFGFEVMSKDGKYISFHVSTVAAGRKISTKKWTKDTLLQWDIMTNEKMTPDDQKKFLAKVRLY
jgi:hypothetical protein